MSTEAVPMNLPSRSSGAVYEVISIPSNRYGSTTPSLRVSLSMDLAGRDPGGRAFGIPAARPAAPSTPLASTPGAGWARTDQVPRVIDVFHSLYAHLKSEITTRYGGTP